MSSPSPLASPASDVDFDWEVVLPDHGEELYVQALQLLGIEMAKAVPAKIKRESITPLGEESTYPLLVGEFHGKTKERTLKLICNISDLYL